MPETPTAETPPADTGAVTAGPSGPPAGREDAAARAHRLRWWTLGVVCFSLLVISLDNTILNTAIPRLVTELGASNSDLQWIVDAYILVFAGLLLTSGSLGDRYGRRGAFLFGMTIFGAGSALSTIATSSAQLIGGRAVMGVGAAFIMPATLSIITNVFPAHERPRAIGVWAATTGVGVALGPIIGGFLLDHFWWGSVFLVNLPVVIAGAVATIFVVPTSYDPSRPRLDPFGSLLSILGLTGLVYAIIEAPERGWDDPTVIALFAGSLAVLVAFALWERRCPQPMLDIRFFRSARFSAASGSVTLVMFALLGGTFMFTQYLQMVKGYSPLDAGVRMLPLAVVMTIVGPLSPRIAERFGAKAVVTAGLLTVCLALTVYMGLGVETSYPNIVWRVMIMAAGVGLALPPATEAIMGALPKAKAGVGSAVNDATRQVGGALGVAVIGSVLSSVYRPRMVSLLADGGAPPEMIAAVKSSLGGALGVAGSVGGDAGDALAKAAREAFVDGMQRGLFVSLLVGLVGAAIAFRYLPARGAHEDEVEAAWAAVGAPTEGVDVAEPALTESA